MQLAQATKVHTSTTIQVSNIYYTIIINNMLRYIIYVNTIILHSVLLTLIYYINIYIIIIYILKTKYVNILVYTCRDHCHLHTRQMLQISTPNMRKED